MFSLRTGAWENDDESSHVLYAEHLVRTGRLPPLAVGSGDEAHQAPLYYVLLAGWQTLLRIPAFRPVLPPAHAAGGGLQYLVLRHDRYTPLEHRQAVWLHELRLLSVACGLLTVLAAYAIGWLLTHRTSTAAATAACVAAWPKVLVVSAAVTNSVLVDALCAWALPCWLLWRRSRAPGWAAATGVVLGAAVLTQVTAIPLAAILLAALAAAALRRRDLRSPLLAVGAAAAVSGWWFVRNTLVHGDPLAAAATARYLPLVSPLRLVRSPPTLSVAVVRQVLPTLAHSTWYSGGWDQLQLPHRVDDLLWVLAGLSVAAALRTRAGRHLVVLAGAVASVGAWLLVIRSATHGQGRYLLTGVTAWSTLLVAGTGRVGPARSWLRWVWPAVFLALDGYLLATVLIPHGSF